MKNRVLALLLCILMCLSMFPASAFAEGGSYYVYFWYTSPLTVNESGYSDCLPVGEAILVDESSDYIIGPVPGSILQGLRSYAQSQNLQDHCIVSWTVKETGEAFDFANRRVDELASEDHTLNLLATWGTENSHNWGDWYTAQEATCSAPGTRTHTCYICRTSASETIPAAHRINPIPVEAEPATCTENGTIAYYVCDDCGTKFYDAEGREAVTDAVAYAPGHALRYCEAEPATCTEDGTIAHYVCDVCGKYFSDAEGANELTTITDPCPGHEMTYYPETAATCTEKGNRAYYYCEKCCGYFGDENGEDPLDATSVVTDVNPNAHEWENGVCIRKGCGAVCNHENAADGVCQTCGETVTHEEKKFTLFAANPLQATSAATEVYLDEDQHITWLLSNNDTLTISGTGAMPDYDNQNPPWYENRQIIRRISIGEGITGIGKSAFSGCTSLTEVSLPSTLNTVSENAFNQCGNMQVDYNGTAADASQIEIAEGEIKYLSEATWTCTNGTYESGPLYKKGTTGSNIKWYLSKDGMLALCGTGAMGSYSPGSGNTEDSLWYSYHGRIKTVVVEDGITALATYAFKDSENLTSAYIPDSLTSLPTGIFQNCVMLTSITIPQGVTNIGAEAFNGCSKLEEVAIPRSITAIGEKAFNGCNVLKKAVYSGTRSEWDALRQGNKIAGGNDPLRDAIIICSDDNKSSNENTSGGTTGGTGSGTGSDTTATSGTIEGSDGTSLTWTLSDAGVLTISGTGVIPAFSEDNPAKWPKERIKTLIIGSGITAIGNNSFSGCTNLKYADLSAASNLTLIGAHAFDGVNDAVIVGNNSARTFAADRSNLTSAEKLSAAGTSSGSYTVLSLNKTVSDANLNKILQYARSDLKATSSQNLSSVLFDIIAIDSSGNRVTNIPDGIAFTLIKQFTAPAGNYGVYHLKADESVEKLNASVSSGALNVTMNTFSPVALVAVQDSGSAETTPQAPTIRSYSDIYDGGATATGSVTVNNPNNRKLEWIWMASNTNPGDSAAGTELVNTNTLSNLTTSGYYFFRFKEDTAAGLPRSAWVGIEVLDYYTITLTPATAENGSFKVSGALKYNNRDNVYYAVKGSKVTVTFEPAEYYELYSLSVNNVDKDPVTGNPLVINGLNAKTDLKYAFRMSVPIVSGLNHVVDNGTRVSGTIQFTTDGREIEYVVQSARPTSATEWKTITGAKIADIKTGGTYWYRYKGQPISKIDSVVIKDYYSVTIDGTGKGSYKVLSTDTAIQDENKGNVYYVLKGDSIKVKFTPDKGWMLYEVDKNGDYITKAKMNELKEHDNTLTIENITNATTIKYVFSDTASSPKTGDQSEVNLWIAEEIVSLLGMTAITWYLFRRKET